ncbi:fimbria/pilus periplasmic chaperone [Enterobacter sp. CC120223-11]|uniref:fimbria/pilus periplasmic chaperone n=1 Tax=Enterobacter sp. CC120223-11 TaxID=1378073 RepID=UPI0026E58E09|nr:fimbria/pilus periplasmic chaperone [Enterobacter sp. CC120223-11]
MAIVLSFTLFSEAAQAAISLDRTRIIYESDKKSVSLSIGNDNKALPFLAQAWLEDERGNKVNSPLAILPPIQRIEPEAKSQVKIQALPAAGSLPADRESLFYFNLREIPPVSGKPNTLQIALQTRIKLFYRPASLIRQAEEIGEHLTLNKVGDVYQFNNDSGLYVTIIDISAAEKGPSLSDFEPVMVAPKSSTSLNVSAAKAGSSPIFTLINDYGGRPKFRFICEGGRCHAKELRGETN